MGEDFGSSRVDQWEERERWLITRSRMLPKKTNQFFEWKLILSSILNNHKNSQTNKQPAALANEWSKWIQCKSEVGVGGGEERDSVRNEINTEEETGEEKKGWKQRGEEREKCNLGYAITSS